MHFHGQATFSLVNEKPMTQVFIDTRPFSCTLHDLFMCISVTLLPIVTAPIPVTQIKKITKPCRIARVHVTGKSSEVRIVYNEGFHNLGCHSGCPALVRLQPVGCVGNLVKVGQGQSISHPNHRPV